MCSSWPNHPWANAHHRHVTETHAWTGTYRYLHQRVLHHWTSLFNGTIITLSAVRKIEKGVFKTYVSSKIQHSLVDRHQKLSHPFIYSRTGLLLFTAPDLWLLLSQYDPLPCPCLAPEKVKEESVNCCLIIKCLRRESALRGPSHDVKEGLRGESIFTQHEITLTQQGTIYPPALPVCICQEPPHAVHRHYPQAFFHGGPSAGVQT